MNYLKHYETLIERSKNRTLDCYVERHHIVPRCMNGTDDPDNIAILTPEEHYVAHQLLVKLHPGNPKLVYAAHMMTMGSADVQRNNKLYGWLRKKHAVHMSTLAKQRIGEKNGSYGSFWITDGKDNRRIKDEKDIPEGWNRGKIHPEYLIRERLCKDCGTIFKNTGDDTTRTYCKNCKKEQILKMKYNKEKYMHWYNLMQIYSFNTFCKLTGFSKSRNSLINQFKKYVTDYDVESLKKIKKAHYNQKTGEKVICIVGEQPEGFTSTFPEQLRRQWYTNKNGQCKQFLIGHEPDGWHRGMGQSSTKGKTWYHNIETHENKIVTNKNDLYDYSKWVKGRG